MKIYSYISALLIAGIASFSSCSQEDMNESETGLSNGLQISVSDGGYLDTTPGTRAIEKGYTTEFTEGDEIGIFGVDANGIVENINNRKCTMTAGGNWEIAGEQIKYNGADFKEMKFYAYYPYNANVKFNVEEDDPFAEYISEWTLDNDQSGEKYTKYDLMTSSSGAVVDNHFKGEINFTMQHCMALAVLKMPKLVYNFVNSDVTLDDYELPVTNVSFKLDNAVVTPYYQESTDTYRFLVKPGQEFKLEGTYTGVKEMTCTATATLNKGTAKVYTVTDTNKKEYTLAVGDYYCADGSIVSKDAEIIPDNVIGIVCYVGNPQPSVTNPTLCTEMNDVLRRDFPSCKHGLAIALNSVNTDRSRFNSGRELMFGDWFTSDDDWKDKLISNVTLTACIDAFLGYNNTVLLERTLTPTACDDAQTHLNTYRELISVPMGLSTNWFIPSLKEFEQIATCLSVVNSSLTKAGGTALTSGGTFDKAASEADGQYWSSNERNTSSQAVYSHNLTTGYFNATRRNMGSYGCFFRLAIAF